MNSGETENLRIRSVVREDLPSLVDFFEPFVEAGKLLPRTTREMDDLLHHGFIADWDGQLVGFAALEIYSRKLAEIRSLAVAPGYQRHGIGKRLVQACVNRAREQQVREVLVITSTEKFFQSCGFDFALPGERKALFLQTRDSSG